MFIKLDSNGKVTLEDPNNFRAFKVVIESEVAGIYNARSTLDGLAELEDEETAWVSQSALRARPEVAQDAAWQQSFGAMIEKARPHGWIDDQRQAIKAHIEWVA